MASYPGAVPTLSNPAPTDKTNNVTTPHATQHSNANDEIEAIAGELGVTPSGSYATVVARLNPGPGGLVRAGCACYTSESEVDRLLEGVRSLGPA